MPELPEVEVIRRELKPQLIGEIFDSVNVFWAKSYENRAQGTIPGKTIIDFDRRGKYLIVVLDKGYLVVHLRMTGQLMIVTALPDNGRHLQVVFRMRSGKYLVYFDARKFGRLIHCDELDGVLKNTGLDALAQEFSASVFRRMLRSRSRMIKSFLMDQKQIAGLGNIYVDESLFRAGIHPRTLTSEIPAAKARLLFEAIKDILNRSIGSMGTTISDYKTVGGGFGAYQNALQVYGRAGELCPVCGGKIAKIRINNRGTHFCARCQKPRRKHR